MLTFPIKVYQRSRQFISSLWIYFKELWLPLVKVVGKVESFLRHHFSIYTLPLLAFLYHLIQCRKQCCWSVSCAILVPSNNWLCMTSSNLIHILSLLDFWVDLNFVSIYIYFFFFLLLVCSFHCFILKTILLILQFKAFYQSSTL